MLPSAVAGGRGGVRRFFLPFLDRIYGIFQDLYGEIGVEDKELTGEIIGASYRVFNELGFGFLESVYEKALMIELDRVGVRAENQKGVSVKYLGESVGEHVIDLFVEGRIVVELKAVQQLVTVHEAQLVNYLSATGIDLGLLINFGPKGVEVKRKYRTYTPTKRDARRLLSIL